MTPTRRFVRFQPLGDPSAVPSTLLSTGLVLVGLLTSFLCFVTL